MRLNKKNNPILSSGRYRHKNVINFQGSRLTIRHYIENNRINSSIFLVTDPNKYYEDMIIKICNYNIDDALHQNRVLRFTREIDALKIADSNGCKNVIKIFHDDFIEIEKKKFQYYLMEKADYTLKNLIEDNRLDISEKVRICIQILNGLKELHNLKIYHRDLKPENILFINNELKICDLGLIDSANEDLLLDNIDEVGEKIGPFGWLSPEAMNKFFTEGKNLEFNFDCNIDYKSDVYQLGKIFWYIFQANLPEGIISLDDFLVKDNEIYSIITSMLQHNKNKRAEISEIETKFEPIRKKLVA
ncbi:serine/threonine protein kinase [Melioribacter roseus P3M-2]|uniref:Serine/threonine protein kinase n=1 Tax=Melioribacter roseus (strain DSM 23840 / JCM 17771 / VKM B-2668 / P3M-2) TaxID=1191523 RepID=I6ZZC2_MELRP|nr:protein kinase [Melioribacter roseus]AFN74353.1 serine/threonine protein kinase [Melioribacter roseus P3M-2]